MDVLLKRKTDSGKEMLKEQLRNDDKNNCENENKETREMTWGENLVSQMSQRTTAWQAAR